MIDQGHQHSQMQNLVAIWTSYMVYIHQTVATKCFSVDYIC